MFLKHYHQLRWRIFTQSFRFNSTSAQMVSVPSGVTNQHFFVGPNGETFVDYSFASEPLGMPAKLGWRMHSSTWLARDTLATKFVAVKVLTGFWTRLC